MPTITDPSDSSQQAAYAAWQAQKPEMQTETGKTFASAVDTWFAAMPTITDPSDSSQQAALAAWKAQSPATATNAFTAAYSGACLAVQTYAGEKALEADPSYTEGTAGYLEILASTMFPINPPDTETDPTGATGMSIRSTQKKQMKTISPKVSCPFFRRTHPISLIFQAKNARNTAPNAPKITPRSSLP